jgi:cellulose synthase/poly-beta-1,6-N-acetylglucosamine synthase-like glycosyltransferase
MLVYEHDRTKDIVNRLVKVAPVVRFLTIFYMVVVMAFLFAIVIFLLNPEVVLVLVAALGGGLFGLILGYLLAAVFNVLLEWMAQSLVAQGSIIAQLRKKNKS